MYIYSMKTPRNREGSDGSLTPDEPERFRSCLQKADLHQEKMQAVLQAAQNAARIHARQKRETFSSAANAANYSQQNEGGNLQ